ncbi:MAG: HNH endonuclease [Patescibacteria group bacterium]
MKLDFQTLYCLYVLEQKTTIEIAAMAGVSSPQTISNWLRKYAIERRERRDAQRVITPPYDVLYRLYVQEEKSIEAIRRLLGSSETSISMLLEKYEIPKRSKTAKSGRWNKGKHLSEEQRHILSEFAKQRIGPKSPRYGEILSDATRARIAKSLKGRFRGEENSHWKGGPQYRRNMWHSRFEYKDWRKAVFIRDCFTCKMCGKPSNGDIEAHHILTWEQYPEHRFMVENGITLCIPCHRMTKGKESQFVEQFQAMTHRPTL